MYNKIYKDVSITYKVKKQSIVFSLLVFWNLNLQWNLENNYFGPQCQYGVRLLPLCFFPCFFKPTFIWTYISIHFIKSLYYPPTLMDVTVMLSQQWNNLLNSLNASYYQNAQLSHTLIKYGFEFLSRKLRISNALSDCRITV